MTFYHIVIIEEYLFLQPASTRPVDVVWRAIPALAGDSKCLWDNRNKMISNIRKKKEWPGIKKRRQGIPGIIQRSVASFLLPFFPGIEAQFSGVDRNGEFHQQGIDEGAGGPDPDSDGLFNKCGHVFVNFTQGTGDKTGN